MLQDVAVEEFEALLGQQIRISSEGHERLLQLKEVKRLQNPSPRPTPPFSVVLRDVGVDRHFSQGIYSLDLPPRGTLDLFIVPIGPDGTGMCYEITFN
ncbi:DUF6916 family protein [Tahibacter amnicola]|uniref:DUF6916 domain-containing protein n=1 Tax=Tahibacter amnicola TaxID=2976241 RepID=A0ABY6BL25_9GAMM|nr:hypothetical protein [Tahibacter amnicola]UXI69281.1 hypothetical protein N4264_06430 [Tahibacter amnicola]